MKSADLFKRSAQLIDEEYHAAALVLAREDPAEACLYGASHSAAYLLRAFPKEVARLRIFDLYRNREILGASVLLHGKEVEPSWLLGVSPLKRAYITTRFWNAYKDIAAWLRLNCPNVEPLSPFASMDP